MQEDCNTCTCLNGIRTCTKVVCGARNCWNHTRAGGCPSGSVCVPKKAVGCLNPPCGRWAECKGGATSSAQSDSGINDEVCLPNSTNLNGDCAKIHIVFSLNKLPKVRIQLRYIYCESLATLHSSHPRSGGSREGARGPRHPPPLIVEKCKDNPPRLFLAPLHPYHY